MPRVQHAIRRQNLLDPRAVRAFLERDLDDWRWVKEVPREELRGCVDKDFRFHTDPRLHQLACFVLGTQLARFMFLLEMGSGKSKLLLDLIRYRKHLGQLRGALICVPNIINLASWEAQIGAHAPDLTFKVLAGTRTKRYQLLDAEHTDICLVNYGGLQTYMASATRRTRKGTTRRDMVYEDAEDFASMFNFVALDECHIGLSSVKTLQYQLTKLLSWKADFAYGATGTPFGRNPEKAWSQFHVIEQGETLGHSLAMFHAAFYTERFHPFNRSGIEYRFDTKKKLLLHRVLQHRSIRYSDKEFSDLPQVNYHSISVQLTDVQVKRYNDLLDIGIEARSEGRQEATWIRLRQTAAGYISVKGEDTERLEIIFSPNPKALALEQYMLELDEDEKVVIFHDYIPSGRIIRDVLTRMKIKHTGVGGGWKDPIGNLRHFLTDPSMRVWVANCRAGGTGTDGLQQVARYGLFYEAPSSPTVRRQSIKRLDRDGQRRRVYITDLVASNVAIDQRVLASLASGIDMFQAVCEGKEKLR